MTGCLALVLAGAAVQVSVGAGLSVVCGPALLLWLGPAAAVPLLLGLNLLVSVVATLSDARAVRWRDAGLAAAAVLGGCLLASALPRLPDGVLKALTACVLAVVALMPPPTPRGRTAASVRGGVTAAGIATGALTAWTATPGPVMAVGLARAGWPGSDIRRTMQPISVVGYGAALAVAGMPGPGAVPAGILAWLVAATLGGTGLGFLLRRRVEPTQVVTLVRVVAAGAALGLAWSLLA